MSIEELKSEKSRVETEISIILNEFIKETTLDVSNVHITTNRTLLRLVIVGCKIDIEIP
jgi:hypothetical protein